MISFFHVFLLKIPLLLPSHLNGKNLQSLAKGNEKLCTKDDTSRLVLRRKPAELKGRLRGYST
jgi:hypothetical protein